jgi:hypothetical protein
MNMDILTNKWVLLGGVAIGAILLIASASSSGGGGDNGPPGINAELFKIQSVNYQAELNANVSLANTAASVTKANITAGTQKTLAVLSSMTNMAQMTVLERVKQVESRAGITNHFIQANTAIALDQQANANRISMARIGANVSALSFQRDITIAQEQGATARYIAKKNANASIWTGAFSAIAKVAPAAIAAL